MSWTTIVAIYLLVWWTVLFAVLPWGVRSQEESGEVSAGTDPGAPAVPRLKAKLLWTTFVATVVFAAFYWAFHSGMIGLHGSEVRLTGIFGRFCIDRRIMILSAL